MAGHNDPSLSSLAEDLREWEDVLRTGRYVNTADILDEISVQIEKGTVNKSILNETLKRLRTSVWGDFIEDVAWRKTMLDDVDAIMMKGHVNFEHLLALYQSAKEPRTTITRMGLMVREQRDPLLRIYLYCFLYVLLLEGVYDENLRFLYAHHLQLPATNPDISVLDIKEKFERDGVGRSLFDGWNPTVRNAIAHATFYIDTGSQRVEFIDRSMMQKDPKKGRVDLSFEDFATLAMKAFDVYTGVGTLLIVRLLLPTNFELVLRAIER